jgi:hypothetical protein
MECPGGSSSSTARWNKEAEVIVKPYMTKYRSIAPCGACLPRDLEIGK